MKLPRIHSLIILVAFLMVGLQLKASSIVGATIGYNYLATNQYLVKVQLYRNCDGIYPPPSIEICCHSDSLNSSITLTLQSTVVPVQLPPCQYLPPVISSCQGGTGFGVEMYAYLGLLVLPAASRDWVLSYTAPKIYDNFFYPNIIVTTKINNVEFPVNSSIEFNSLPYLSFCVTWVGTSYYDALDADGDSLRYELIPTLADSHFCPPQVTLPDPATFLYFQPSSSIPIYIHPTNGWMNLIPDLIQLSFLSFKIKEYRTTGELVNETTTSHMVATVSGCVFSGLNETPTNTVKTYPVPVNDVLTVELSSPSTIKITSSTGQVIYQEEVHTGINGKTQIDVGNYSPGLYYLTLISGDAITGNVFVKN